MTPTFPPSPAQGETAGVREQRLRELISSVPNGGSQYEVDLHAALCELVAVRQQLAELQREKAAAVGLQQGTALVVKQLEQQLADSAHEVERLNAANAAMRGAVEKAEREMCVEEVDPDDCRESVLAILRAALAPTSHDPVRSVGETRPVPERGKPFSAQEALRQPPPNRYSEFPDCAQPSRGKCETCAGTKVNPKWSAGDRFAAMDCPDCAQPERQGADDRKLIVDALMMKHIHHADHAEKYGTQDGFQGHAPLAERCKALADSIMDGASVPSPPPTDDIVAGVDWLELKAAVFTLRRHNHQAAAAALEHAIAALEGAK